MHGNVAEWCRDQWDGTTDYFMIPSFDPVGGSFAPPKDARGRPLRFPHTARGGSWRDSAKELRCANRLASEAAWNQRDPQIPRSWWYLTEGQHIGFRVVRPLEEPTAEERARFEAL